MKYLLFVGMMLIAMAGRAQNAFWSFNDEQQPMTIAPECDARFEEVRGGVFMPTVDELYQNGMAFLASSSDEVRRQAPYCLLAAALQGNVDAQFQLAKLYNRGDILPQDDLSSYKWSFLAALSGNKDAELFVLNLEQVLTTQDLEATNSAIRQELTRIQENMRKQQEELNQAMQGKGIEQKDGATASGLRAPMPTNMSNIFTEKDSFGR